MYVYIYVVATDNHLDLEELVDLYPFLVFLVSYSCNQSEYHADIKHDRSKLVHLICREK